MDVYDLRNWQCFRRDQAGEIRPWIDWTEPEAPAPRRPSSIINLLILSIFMPYEIVRDVEQVVGWPEIPFRHREGGHLHAINVRELGRVVQAFRDISRRRFTSDIQYVMQNLPSYKMLLQSVLHDLQHCREVRSLRPVRPLLLPRRQTNDLPIPHENDLIRHANSLERFLHALDYVDSIYGYRSFICLNDIDEHIFTVHLLIEFLG